LSLSGAVFSTCIMGMAYVLYKKRLINVLTISILGAAAHNFAQVMMASWVINQPQLITYYLPVLLLIAVPTGVFTGLSAMYLHKIVNKNVVITRSINDFRN
ncbi:MAG: hypothetical protein CVU88_01190, partial [Firmicutes bacterium HGW-Firmicutes-13]